jgi:hypothetical protein
MTASIIDLQEGARFFFVQWMPMNDMGTQGARDTALILQNLSAMLYLSARQQLGIES